MGGPVIAVAQAVGTFLFSTTVGRIASNVAVQYGLSVLSRKLAPGVDNGYSSAYPQPQQVTSAGAATPRAIVYGTATKAGSLVFNGVGGAQNKELWEVHAYADHEIDQFITLYLDNYRPINLATDLDANGFCTLPEFTDTNGDRMLQVVMREGSENQNAITEIVNAFPEWTASHQGRGVAYIGIRYLFDDSPGGDDPDVDVKNVWDKGKPQNARVKIRGKKVYDPRDAGQDINDKTTWQWSDNAALCLADYLRIDPNPVVSNTFGEDPARIDYATVAAAADTCDEAVIVPDGLGGTTTQKRYTVDMAFTLDTQPSGIYEVFRFAMNGGAVYTGGMWSIYSGSDAPSVATITGDWLAGAVSIQEGARRNDRVNTVKGVYAAEATAGQLIEFQARQDAALVSADGGELADEIQQPATTDEYRAQRLGWLHIRGNRSGRVVSGSFKLHALQLAIADVVTLDLSNIGVTGSFTVDSWRLTNLTPDPESAPVVAMKLTEVYSSDVGLADLTEVTLPDSLDEVLYRPAPVTGAIATGTVGAIKLDWSNPPQTEIERVDIWSSTSNDRTTAMKLSQTTAEEFIDVVGNNQTRYYWLKVYGRNGLTSDWTPNTNTTTITATSTAVTGGQDAISVGLTSNRYQFTYDDDGTNETLAPVGQEAKLTVTRENITNAPIWTTTPNVALSGAAGDAVRSITGASFGNLQEVLVQVQVGTYIREVTISRTINGIDGQDAVTADLSNDPVVINTDENYQGNYGPASGSMTVSQGNIDRTGQSTFSLLGQGGGTFQIDANGNYQMNTMTADSANATFQASYNGLDLPKTFNVNANVIESGPPASAAVQPGSGNYQVTASSNFNESFNCVLQGITGASFLWEIFDSDSTDISINGSTTSPTVILQATGNNPSRTFNLRCTVTANEGTFVAEGSGYTLSIIN